MLRSNRTSSPCGLPSVGFIGISKTGSVFVAGALELFAHEQLLTTTHRQLGDHPCAVGARFGWHHASAVLWHRAFGAAWKSAFTFAIVRNPWTRLVSHWAFHLVSKHPLDGGLLALQHRQSAKTNETLSIHSFRSWARHVRHHHPPGSSTSWRFFSSDAHGNEHARGYNASQVSWLVDEHGQLLVSAVYKLEELSARWPEIQARVCGLSNVPYARLRQEPAIVALDHPSKHSDPADYYDDETAAIVAEYHAADIAAFGYRRPVRSH